MVGAPRSKESRVELVEDGFKEHGDHRRIRGHEAEDDLRDDLRGAAQYEA